MGGWGSLLGIERLGATAFPVGAGETERQIELMWRIKSTELVTTPSYALHMLEVARSMGLDPSTSPSVSEYLSGNRGPQFLERVKLLRTDGAL